MNNRIKVVAMVGAILLLLLLSACSTPETVKAEPGIVEMEGGTCYVFDSNGLLEVSKNRAEGVMIADDVTGKTDTVAIYYRTLDRGTRLIYMENSSIVMYVPASVTASSLMCCSKLYANHNNYMSYDEAKQYLPDLLR